MAIGLALVTGLHGLHLSRIGYFQRSRVINNLGTQGSPDHVANRRAPGRL